VLNECSTFDVKTDKIVNLLKVKVFIWIILPSSLLQGLDDSFDSSSQNKIKIYIRPKKKMDHSKLALSNAKFDTTHTTH